MKYYSLFHLLTPFTVAPLAGAWIEIPPAENTNACEPVAPLAGAWIEIGRRMSLERFGQVAPLAGAWIEIRGVREMPSGS